MKRKNWKRKSSLLPELVKGERPPSEKLSHAAVGFEDVSRHDDEHCSKCEHFIPANVSRCQAVKNPIPRVGWCKRYEAKE
jgi:hypothetical protein